MPPTAQLTNDVQVETNVKFFLLLVSVTTIKKFFLNKMLLNICVVI